MRLSIRLEAQTPTIKLLEYTVAKARVIFQPVLGGVFHATEVGKLLAAKTPKAVTISSAYVRIPTMPPGYSNPHPRTVPI